MLDIVYGKIRSYLEKQGTPIAPLDTLIAPYAASADMILVTYKKESSSYSGELDIWMKNTNLQYCFLTIPKIAESSDHSAV